MIKKINKIIKLLKNNKLSDILFSFLKISLRKKGFFIEKITSEKKIKDVIANIRKNYIGVNLIRIGENRDGGYLVPDCMQSIKYCFSLGVDDLVHFEEDLYKKYGIKSFFADGSIESIPNLNKNFTFTPKFIGLGEEPNFISLSDYVNESIGVEFKDNNVELLLQMDIEGGEYDVLTSESSDFFSRFSVIVLEFHQLQNFLLKEPIQMIDGVFNKLFKNFSICHIHPHNGTGLIKYKDIEIPRSLEISLIRKDKIEKLKTDDILVPHPLDITTISNREDFILPEIWWKK